MTLKHTRGSSGSERTTPQTTPRLRLKPKAPATGYVDGAWWPHGDDLTVELPDLLAVLSVRLKSIERVIYNLGDWAKAPTTCQLGGSAIRLDGSASQPVDTIQVIGTNGHKIVLLVVPPGADRGPAHDAMMSAAAPDNSATIEDLLRDLIENGG